jgi:hypothetical protein
MVLWTSTATPPRHPRELKTANRDNTGRDEESRFDQNRDDGIHSLEMHDGWFSSASALARVRIRVSEQSREEEDEDLFFLRLRVKP